MCSRSTIWSITPSCVRVSEATRAEIDQIAETRARYEDEIVRATLLLRVNTLAKGFSGVSRELLRLLLDLLNRNVLPQIPEKGSLGASGDLAPLAHMSLVLMGEGKARFEGQTLDAVYREAAALGYKY